MQESQDPAFLREQAAKCRRLAGSINDRDAAATLRKLADDYEAKAGALDGAQIDVGPLPIISPSQETGPSA